jgi:hypothetical protein
MCLWCYFIHLSVSICYCWWCDDACEVLLIDLNIFLCLCYFAFFGWPYVNASDAANIYLFLKYTLWFLLTWTACPRVNPSCFAALDKSMRSWLSLFYVFFCFVIVSEVFIYVKPDNIYMPLLFCNFSPHMSVAMLFDTKYLLLNYTMWICCHDYQWMCFMIFLFWSIFICFHGYCFLQLQLAWAQGGHVSVESFGRSIMVSRLRFPLAISTVYHYKLRQLLA